MPFFIDYYTKNINLYFSEFVDERGNVVDTRNPPSPTSAPDHATIPTQRPTQAPVCQASLTAVQGHGPVCTGKLIFSEEFEQTSLRDLTNWEAANQFPEQPVSFD